MGPSALAAAFGAGIVAGLGAAVFSFWHLSPDLGLLALALTLLLTMDFAVRYQIHRRRERT